MENSRPVKSNPLIILFTLIILLGFAITVLIPQFQSPSVPGAVPDSTRTVLQDKNDSIYKAILSNADLFYAQKKFRESLAELQKAAAMKPSDTFLKDKITRVKAAIVQQDKTNEQFATLIQSADKYFIAKDYLNAKATYQLALDLKPDDAYARGRMNETMTLLRSQKATNILYDVALAAADKLFQAKDYEKAKVEYEKAGQILPNETYPKEKINEIIKIQVDAQVRDELYAAAITKADNFYNSKKYQSALTEYKNALKQKPDEQYPQDRIKELTDLLGAQKAKDEAYLKAIAMADQLFAEKQYTEARTAYTDAGKLKPLEPYPPSKIKEIDDILAKLKRADEEYDRLIALADSLYIDKDFIRARQNYQLALQIKPNEAYPKEMLNKTGAGVASLEQSQKALDDAYNSTIANADKLLAQKSYDQAKTEYTNALGLKPAESYPKTKIAEIDKVLADQAALKSLDEKYTQTIAAADKLFEEKSYDASKVQYSAALKIKPSETYPQSKITEINGILADLAKQKSLDDQYASAIAKGDQLLGTKQYDLAAAQYTQALTLKPGEAYPTGKLQEIEKIKADIAAQLKSIDDQYLAAVADGDKQLAEKAYQPAKEAYQKALGLKPNETYPKTKITEIDQALAAIDKANADALAKQKALDDQYASAIAKGDQLLGTKQYDQAAAQYKQALALKPGEAYPTGKLQEIEKIKADIAAQLKSIDDQYAAAVADGDKQLSEKAYQPAKEAYQKALGLKPNEAYPKTKITEIDQALAAIEKANAEALAKQKALDDQYASAIAKGDQFLGSKQYDQAAAQYTQALTLKPGEAYPTGKLQEIEKIRADIAAQLKSIDDQYASAIADGDRQLSEKSYQPAKEAYQKALGLKPNEAYPKTKITEIDQALAAIEKANAEALAKQKALDDQYASAIAKGDQLLGTKQYDQAAAQYTQALTLKPQETYPKEKLKEIDGIKAEIARQAEIDKQYNGLLVMADKLFADKSYVEARKSYTDALAVKPGEKYPTDRIAEIDQVLGEVAKQKALDEQYAAAIAEGDKLLGIKSYEPAKTEYSKALTLKPAEAYPKTKITEIDQALAEIARLKALDDQYSQLIAEGDQLLASKTYEQAKIKYTEALKIKPAEKYPQTKISEIDADLAALAKQKALDDQYGGLIAEGDQLLAAKEYDQSVARYTQASALKPAEAYPKEKIQEISKIKADIAAQKKAIEDQYSAYISEADKLAVQKSYEAAKASYVKALELKPAEKYPVLKISAMDSLLAIIAKQKAIDESYANAITAADKLFNEKSLDAAKAGYQDALTIKPSETYPKTQIAAIDKQLGDLAHQKAIDDQYNTALAAADKLLADKSYAEARVAYQNVLKIKPNEQYPKDKISEIDIALAEIAKQKTINDQYKSIVATADQLFTAKSFDQSRVSYTEALKLKPAEQYPKDRISEIDTLLAEIKRIDARYNAAIGSADKLMLDKKYEDARGDYQNASAIKPGEQYPREKIAEINRILSEIQGKKVTYDKLVKNADDLLATKDYMKSKETYQQASVIFPEEAYPRERITFITNKVDSIYRANKADYDKAVANGDKFYYAFEFDKAVDAYTEAINFLPMENYPREMIAKIRKTIEENAIVDVLRVPTVIHDGDTKKFGFEPVNIASRKDNFIYLKLTNLSGKPFNVLMRYGKDDQPGGGVVIRNLSVDGKMNERLISVRDQDPWYRADNNWISITPQGGEIEVSFIQVSKVK